MDILVPISMKNAAKCDKQCELQNSASHQIFERKWRWFTSMFVSVCSESHKNSMRLKALFGVLSFVKWWRGAECSASPKRSSHFLIESDLVWEIQSVRHSFKRSPNKYFIFSPSTPEIKQGYLLNLSISVSRGKETNKDCLSSGEWRGKSSKWKSVAIELRNCNLERFSEGMSLA